MASIQNIAGYKFETLDIETIRAKRLDLRAKARDIGVKGSILLGSEGCNMFLAAEEDKNQEFLEAFYEVFPNLSDIKFKVSWSESAPFTRMLIKEKKEIITLAKPKVNPIAETAPEIDPEKFAQDFDSYLVVDTRNNYETELGKFSGSVDLNIDSFRDFPEAMKRTLPPVEANKPIVIYCTGGIRCEKAGLWMSQAGYKNVYQLKDGILGYFEKCGNQHYEGECFVFDKRVGLDHNLKETSTKQCYNCRTPWTAQAINERNGVCKCGKTVHWYEA